MIKSFIKEAKALVLKYWEIAKARYVSAKSTIKAELKRLRDKIRSL
tara:strand:- start:419 stop:556 length:138 start_codon:yes stop_codon:yes gene_type:complete